VVRDVGGKDPKPENGPLHLVADCPSHLGGDLRNLALQFL
jgi:hypothetical protein